MKISENILPYNKSSLQLCLINWYKKNRRFFPWRNYCHDPYKIMIAEFMLHRTRAEQIIPIYKNFLGTYPDLQKLANARVEDIKTVTNHLGLHWRSSHFIKAAQCIIDNYHGVFPENRKELLKIPGIGDYVAGAILAVCYSLPDYVIDSNIARFINRFYGLKLTGEIRRKKAIKEQSGNIFNYHDTRTLLFAILDFTALVCKPKNPDCGTCILISKCNYITDNEAK